MNHEGAYVAELRIEVTGRMKGEAGGVGNYCGQQIPKQFGATDFVTVPNPAHSLTSPIYRMRIPHGFLSCD
jgi:hypothetical protein